MDRLTEAEVGHYHEQGFVVPNFTLAEDVLNRIERRLGTFLSENPELPTDFINGLLEKDPSWISVARQPEILDTVEQLIGPDFALWAVALFGKPAHDGTATPWHQDGEYWPIRPLATCTVWIALDASTSEYGCLRVVPGSHKNRELFPHENRDSEGLNLHCVVKDEAGAEANGKDIVLRRGQISVHDVYMIHGSRPNTSASPRRGLTLRFMPTTSHFDYNLAEIQAKEPGVNDLTSRQLHLMRGTDVCSRNNFNVGRMSDAVSVNVGPIPSGGTRVH